MKQDAYKLYSSLPIYSQHKTWAEIDLSALRHNYHTLLRMVNKGTEEKCKLICVMKADSYGHGADACTRVLLEEGCSFFAVSCIEEAVALRTLCEEMNKNAQILILGYTLPISARTLAENNICQTVFSPEYAEALNIEASRQKCRVKCHIKLDTGMNRLGFVAQSDKSISEAVREIEKVSRFDGISIEGMFTHFAKADERPKDSSLCLTKKQFERFQKVSNLLSEKGIQIPLRHVSNSAASMLFPEYNLDCVREGILLYGARPSLSTELKELKPVMSLKTVISHIHTVSAGESVSYGGLCSFSEERRLATIPIGYADGFLRSYSGALVSIATKSGRASAKIVGRICMDQCMIDITDTDADIGDIVSLFGETPSQLYELAEKAGTIDYESLCLISGRVPRVYK